MPVIESPSRKPMKILALADHESPYLWNEHSGKKLREYDLILSAGDLKASYLSFLVTMARCPLLYVHGNHDGPYTLQPPEGCDCIDGRLVTVNGLRILGLGGSLRYNDGPCQYTEKEMRWRVIRLMLQLHRAGGVDIVLTHAPIAGYGDLPDRCHTGFEVFAPLIEQTKPAYFLHGHVHLNYGGGKLERVREYPFADGSGGTRLVNCYEKYEFEL